MKYKALKSAAHNFGHSFASGLNWRGNDYVMSHLARAVGRTTSMSSHAGAGG